MLAGELIRVTLTDQISGSDPVSKPTALSPYDFEFEAGPTTALGSFVESGNRLPNAANHAFGDIDGDGDIDAVSHLVWLNDGTGRFASQAQPDGFGGVLVDTDNDGDLDVVGRSLWLNDGAGQFSLHSEVVGDRGWIQAAEDLNADGLVDLVVGSRDGELVENRIWWNETGTMFSRSETVFPAGEVFARDFDADGDIDLLIGLRFFNREGDRYVEDPFSFPESESESGHLDIEVNYFDRDTIPDVVLAERPSIFEHEMSTWYSEFRFPPHDSDGKYENVPHLPFGQNEITGQPSFVTGADFDGDGRRDIVFVAVDYNIEPFFFERHPFWRK